MSHDPSVAYAEEATDAELGKLQVAFSVEGDGLDIAEWECPRCGARFRQSFRRDSLIYKVGYQTVEPSRERGWLDLLCRCGVKHPGGEAKPGCGFGARFPVLRP